MRNQKIIPIFYTCDNESIESMVASLRSIINNRDKSYDYNVCVLHNGIDKGNMKKVFDLSEHGFDITLEDMSAYTSNENVKISFSSDFVRAFIPEMFPGYGKSILVSSDYVASEDISAYFESASASNSLFRIGC